MSSPRTLDIEPEHGSTLGRVLAGYDGSLGADIALEWAAREAVARGSSLRIGPFSATAMQYDLVKALADRHPELNVDLTAPHPGAHQGLLDEAGSADLLVLTAASGEAARDVLHRSIAREAMRRSPCPVVVVRGETGPSMRRIVVGTDGSNAAAAALDWACGEANIHGSELVVIHARERDLASAEAQCVLDLAVNECRDRTNARVRGLLVEGSPASSLIHASLDADMVAIGSRGRSGFKTVVFGSVALSVAGSAHCPVAVTHPQLRRD
jgi:nucleotide-binding universal stress UspA family protein